MKLGTWSTFDCPIKGIDKAEEFLRIELDKIGGEVRKVYNPHDFGEYPSFEIDKPDKFDRDFEIIEEMTEEEKELEIEYNNWIDKINELEQKYSELIDNPEFN